ncbi:MAG: rRNA maturation RNase YbeY [Chloroflexi bacterium]|nr:rRNA maturation RNase YbeY [Chloroflexota bacterium]
MSSGLSQGPELELDVEAKAEFADQIDVAMLRGIVQTALATEGISRRVELSLVITDDDTIRHLNATYRGTDEATDVLSFPLTDRTGPGKPQFVSPPDEVLYLGDVVVSFPRAVEQAREYGHSLRRELAYLIVHGVFHLLGYDHETEQERRRMRDKEEAALVGVHR